MFQLPFLFLKINSDWNIKSDFKETFNYDILSLKKSDFNKNINIKTDKKTYNFYLTKSQHSALKSQLKQYRSDNINSTLRHMTVTGSTEQFFYKVS